MYKKAMATKDTGSALQRFVHARPFLWHLTARSNAAMIQASGRLDSAATTLSKVGRAAEAVAKRSSLVDVEGGLGTVCLRDQAPLHQGNVALSGGWTFGDLVRHLNDFVFFWPGTSEGPIDYGIRHFARYRDQATTVLRVPTLSLLTANTMADVRVCRYNSGSPRCSGGRKSPRGPGMFVPLDQFEGTPSQVVELVVRDGVQLPADTEWRPIHAGTRIEY